MSRFHVANEEEIRKGETTDIYFKRTQEILEKEGKNKQKVVAEFTTSSLPGNWEWGVFCGLEEVLNLMKGKDVNIYSFPEGSIFFPKTCDGIMVPVMVIEGPYREFCIYETPMLGMICQASGIATKSSRVRKAARDKKVISFGIRRMHPAISPMIDRAAYVGGCDEVSSLTGAKAIGKEPQGTMPHSLTIVLGDPKKAFLAFDKHMPKEVPRIALVDTYYDEVREALIACESVANLKGVRLDTPSSRKGDFPDLVREVRWELNVRGYKDVAIFLSGGLDETNIPSLVEAGADGFGVGTSISNAPTLNFAMDIVEMEGRPVSKRGKFSGKKKVYRCSKDLTHSINENTCPICGKRMEPILKKFMEKGRIIRDSPSVDEIRSYLLRQLEHVEFRGER